MRRIVLCKNIILPLTVLLFTAVQALRNPEQIHISHGDDDHQMTIMWSSQDDINGYVQYGLSPQLLTDTEYSEKSVLQSDSWNALKVVHRTKLKNLKLGEVYHYRVVCESKGNSSHSSMFSFKTAPGTIKPQIRALFFGDMGAHAGQPTFAKLEKEVKTGKYDVVFHVGDMAYDLHSDGGAVGDLFMNGIQDVAANIPYMTSPGNHELRDQFHHYRTRFSMPNTEWPMPKDKLWYSYDIGPVHFISYSTEAYFSDDQDFTCTQYEWLQNDLIEANNQRHVRPWIVAMGHRPMYCSNSIINFDDCTGRIFGYWVKHGLEDLFYEQGVDLVLQAHEHDYERLWPVYDFQVISKNYNNPRAPVHIISGAAGSNEGTDPMRSPDPWSAFQALEKSVHSYGRIYVPNATHLHIEQVIAKTGEVLDSIWMVQNKHGPFAGNVTCTGSHKSKSCTCPKPLPYIIIGSFAGVILLSLIALSIALCCYLKRKKGKCNCISCRKTSTHYRLVDHIDSDEDIVL